MGLRCAPAACLTCMDMSVTNCWGCTPEWIAWGMAALLFFPAPVGAWVLRRHIAEATGPWRWAGKALQAMAFVSMPFAALLVLGLLLQVLMDLWA